MDNQAMFKLSYGLFVLSAREGEKDNGCIINTAMQVTDNPKQLAVAVNKCNFTHDMILRTGVFALSVLTEKVPFAVFERFGFQSGREAEKFSDPARTARGIAYYADHTNAVFSCKVKETVDCGTHTLFIGEVEEATVLNEDPSVTYAYYFEHIKPKPKAEGGKKKYVCEICGFVYEGEELPEDYVCPLCNHGTAFFKEI